MAAPVKKLYQVGRLPKAFSVRLAEQADISSLDAFSGKPGRAGQRLATGDLCLLAVSEGTIHAVEWIKLGPSQYLEDVEKLGVVFRVPPRCCWLYDGKTNDDGQSMGFWGAVMGRLRVHLESNGIENAYLQIGYSNPYSVACHKSLGFHLFGWLIFLRLCGRRLVAYRAVGKGWDWVREAELVLPEQAWEHF
jgi:hypothetical protein